VSRPGTQARTPDHRSFFALRAATLYNSLHVAIKFSVILILVLATAAFAQQPSTQMTELRWISGCWNATTTDGSEAQEQWTKPEGGTMFGVMRIISAGQTISFRYMQIRQKVADVLFIFQQDGGQPVTYKLVKLNDSEAVFENSQHDPPQRIVYQRLVDGTFIAAIDGEEAGKPKRSILKMQRTRCD